MRRLTITVLVACLVITGLIVPVRADPGRTEIVTTDEALTVASNWITLILHYEGNWGGSATAQVAEVREFKRGDRVIGYFCRVEPKGFIVVSLRKELAPVKAYSANLDIDPQSDEGVTDVIKRRMEDILDAIEQQIGPIQSARAEDVENILEINHRPSWDKLVGNVRALKAGLESGEVTMDYQEGEELLSSIWHQGGPYNWWCPPVIGTEPCTHAKVGCVATAAAQIMRYWAWPPYGVGWYNDDYDWPNMPDELTGFSPQAQIDAVAELCHEVGEAAGTDYGCNESTAWLGAKPGMIDMTEAYQEYFRYNENTDFEQRWHYSSTEEWFNIIKTNIDANQPLQYGLLDLSVGEGFAGHSMVADGWKIVGSTRMVHMIYGQGFTGDWEDITDLPGAEGMIRKIRPAPSLGDWLGNNETYSKKSFNYRYFNRDATGGNVTFAAGQKLQFLPGVTVKCTSTTGGYIRFEGSSSDNTRLFSIKGTELAGIQIYNGGIRLYQNGSIRFH